MKYLSLPFLLLALLPAALTAQQLRFSLSPSLSFPPDSLVKNRLLTSLDGFLQDKDRPGGAAGYTDTAYLRRYQMGFDEIQFIENSKKYNDSNFFRPQLTNIIKINPGEYLIKLAFAGVTPDRQPVVRKLYSMVAREKADKFIFYPAVDYVVKDWQHKQVGRIHYVYPHTLDLSAAKRFDEFNTALAAKFGVKPVALTYYHCSSAQELLRVKGVDFDATASYLRRGDSDEENNIFMSGINSPLYKHDLVHFYCAKFFPKQTCRPAEEGLAYYMDGGWGESYEKCLKTLKDYAAAHPDTNLYEPFKNNLSAGDISLKHTISALLVATLDKREGFAQVLAFIRGENTDERMLKNMQQFFGITPQNFNEKVRKLLTAG
ncbi:hypothetical protein [Chitinophaga solisilvae]|uniref:hypothetical protein n=1 Tax=Chitinophaga solisilvae TaxID=1233460 RepID=UPI00136AC323|nr:hypothetical protein [Chitinophaga solisilvae]